MVAEPLKTIKKTIEFCDLDWESFTRTEIYGRIKDSIFENRNFKWENELTKEEQNKLMAAIKDKLEELGYDL